MQQASSKRAASKTQASKSQHHASSTGLLDGTAWLGAPLEARLLDRHSGVQNAGCLLETGGLQRIMHENHKPPSAKLI